MAWSIEFFAEDGIGPKWRRGALEYWPRLCASMPAAHRPPSIDDGWAAMATYMPELLPVYEGLIAASPDESMQRMVPMWNPPPLFSGCSVACVGDHSPVMLRNYDFDPVRFEGRVWLSRLTGTAVLASVEGTWGALDGVNEHGLVVALTFGGGVEHGRGFAIPMIVRYLLETCATVSDARAALARLPSASVQNVAVLDRTGTQLVAYLRPGQIAEFEDAGIVTNHQPGAGSSPVEDFESSQLRLAALQARVPTPEDFLAPPLYTPGRTLYSVAYGPAEGVAHFFWPGQNLVQSLSDFTEQTVNVSGTGAAA